MKIGIEAQRIFRVNKHGMDMVVLELVRNIQLLDSEHEFFVFVKADKDTCLESSEKVKIIEVKGRSYPEWEQLSLPRAVKKHRCDILHCTSNTAPFFIKTPIIITLHDIIYMKQLLLFQRTSTWYQKMGNLYRRTNVPWAVKKALKIITVSKTEMNSIHNYFKLPDSKIVSIYNGVSQHFRKITNADELERVRKKYKLPESFFLFFANTDPKKNTSGVFKAYSKYLVQSDVKTPLLLVDFSEKELLILLKRYKLMNIKDHIINSGYIINADLPAIYSLSEFFLYPSLHESFGIPVLEAMSCGTAVITSNTSSLPEISAGGALLVDPTNPGEITQAMITLQEKPEIKKKYIRRGSERIKDFSWKEMAKQVIQVYSETLQKLN